MSIEESENDPLKGSGTGCGKYREIYRRVAAATAIEAVAVRGLRFADSRRTRMVWMSSRERLRAALKESPISLPLPFTLLPSLFIHQCRFAPRYFSYSYFLGVRAMRDAPSVFPLSPSVLFSTTVGIGRTPVLKGASSHIPFAPIFHKRY